MAIKARKAQVTGEGTLDLEMFNSEAPKHRSKPQRKAETKKINSKKPEATEPRDAVERSLLIKSSEYVRDMVKGGRK